VPHSSERFFAAGRGGSSIPTRSRTPTATMLAKKRTFNCHRATTSLRLLCGESHRRKTEHAQIARTLRRARTTVGLWPALSLMSVIEGCEVELGEAHGVDEELWFATVSRAAVGASCDSPVSAAGSHECVGTDCSLQ
jgi:hypothetical protein